MTMDSPDYTLEIVDIVGDAFESDEDSVGLNVLLADDNVKELTFVTMADLTEFVDKLWMAKPNTLKLHVIVDGDEDEY